MNFKFILFIILIPFICHSQNYIPFPHDSAQWNCVYNQYGNTAPNDNWFEGDQLTYLTNGDTLFSGLTYTQLFQSGLHITDWIHPFSGSYHNSYYYFPHYIGCYRNDTLNKLVLFLPRDSINEKILYNFNISVSDTVNWFILNPNCSFPDTFAIVQSIDSILINGIYRRSITLNTFIGMGNVSIIEGIGSTSGLFNPLTYDLLGCDGRLNCFKQNGQVIYPDSITTCDVINGIQNFEIALAEIYPIPSQGKLLLKNISGFSDIVVYNILGCEVYKSKNYSSENQIDLSNLDDGLYFLRLNDDHNKSKTIKFIISK